MHLVMVGLKRQDKNDDYHVVKGSRTSAARFVQSHSGTFMSNVLGRHFG